jgi:hypothetical protein
MPPSPSQSPPPPSTSSKPLRTSSRQDPVKAPPPPIQATTASIYSAAHHDDQPDDLEDENDGYPPLDPKDEITGSLLPPINFRPLFTIVTDPQNIETYHPAVYYVFSDDAENEREGNDVTTVAALRALGQTAQRQQQNYQNRSHSEDEEIEERFIIVDLEPVTEASGISLKVKSTSSLSPSWAVSSTKLRPAPTFDEESEESESLMLQVEGIELAEPVQTTFAEDRRNAKIKKEEAERKAANLLQEARKRGGGTVVQGMEEIWKDLNTSLTVLDKVIGEELPSQSSK